MCRVLRGESFLMEYASDEINIGYRTVMLFIANEHTLIDKLQKIREIEPNTDLEEQGGLGFVCVVKNSFTGVEVTMNRSGTFNIKTITHKGLVEFQKESAETLINYLNIIYINMVDDEDKLLSRVVDPYLYRKTAKKMHYRERHDT